MGDLGSGYYMLTLWADAAGVSGAAVRANFKATYGESVIEEIGRATHGLFYGEVSSAMREMIDDGASKLSPTSINIKNAMLKASGYAPGLFSTIVKETPKAIVDGVSNVAGFSKYIVIGVVAIAVIYAVANAGKISASLKGLKGAA